MGRTYDYGRPRATAKRLITRFGVEAELRLKQNGPRYKVTMVLEDYASRQIDGSRILAGDFRGLIAASSVEPLNGAPALALPPGLGDMLFWGGKIRQVINGGVVQPGPEAVLYTVQIRGPRW